MAFKKIRSTDSVPESPEELIRDLPRRKFPDAMDHQKQVMKLYMEDALDRPDVALQLPTGSGKTLVGLLIAEWRRRKFKEKIVYLCPTKQLVNQVVEQAEEKYGITVRGFTRSKNDYDSTAKAEYQNADCVAITTYSSLFNTNPFFNDADIIILDDAHASENYISHFWSLQINRLESELSSLHEALCLILKPFLKSYDYARLRGEYNDKMGSGWVDKITTKDLISIRDEVIEVIDAHKDVSDIGFTWSLIRDHLHACQIYLSSNSILIRPLIPPTWTHDAFSNPKQRIYMSATLGSGGDLERLMGRKSIYRIPVPGEWDKQGVGRRFFIFPEMSFDKAKTDELKIELMKKAGRSLVLVPNNNLLDEVSAVVSKEIGFDIYKSTDIEVSKKVFIESPKSVAIMSNRYDGIDFPGDECRLLFIEGLPKATNLQEKFIMHRMTAAILFNERIQTRVLQAIGRCTRSLEDYSAIVISGEDLTNYLGNIKKREYFHPELQAELKFGIEQSKDAEVSDLVENFEIFFENGDKWEEANNDIVLERKKCNMEVMAEVKELESIANDEIDYQINLWKGDFPSALSSAEKIIGGLSFPELKGYRAWWNYLAGSAAYLSAESGDTKLLVKARQHYETAKKANTCTTWLSSLSRIEEISDYISEEVSGMDQIERVEEILSSLGAVNERKYAAYEKSILEGIENEKTFEDAHKKVGELLGFNADKIESDGSPDPWWISGNICFVFEDHAGANSDTTLDVKKARQASSHPNWMKEHVEQSKQCDIIPVLITPVTKASEGAWPHLNNVYVWPIDNFREWVKNALGVIREIRKTFVEPGDLKWRTESLERFKEGGMDSYSISQFIKSNPAKNNLEQENA